MPFGWVALPTPRVIGGELYSYLPLLVVESEDAMTLPGFEEFFESLTGHAPRAYQIELSRRMSEGELPEALDVPTGMGKTLAVVVAWVHALAADVVKGRPGRVVPRRLHLVSDRRVVRP